MARGQRLKRLATAPASTVQVNKGGSQNAGGGIGWGLPFPTTDRESDPVPSLTSVVPSSLPVGTATAVVLTGTNFGLVNTLTLTTGITASQVTTISATQINAVLTVASNADPAGSFTASVTTSGMVSGSVALTVTQGPDTLSGLALWLKADAITGFNDGDNLTTWRSSEGQAYTFTKPSYVSGVPQYKTNIVNGLPVARHIGSGSSNKRLNCNNSAFFVASPTLFVVMAWKTATTGIFRRAPGCRPSANIGYGICRNDGGVASEYNTALSAVNGTGTYVGGHGTSQPEPAAEQNGVFHVAELARTTGSGWGYYTNGTQSGGFSADANLTVPVGDDPFSTCCFFDTGTSVSDGLTREDVDVAEILLYNRSLTATERSIVRLYLSRKYAITVV